MPRSQMYRKWPLFIPCFVSCATAVLRNIIHMLVKPRAFSCMLDLTCTHRVSTLSALSKPHGIIFARQCRGMQRGYDII
ncbi:hypothetical protein BKA67DRAFT_256221 [Truncatella angustata]|uniref:Uncharacterized protein n=1 Tax=Truncatella angustata TaxID=152316 RepID=A0A9P8ZZF7_9PEZI|nr:uncharacterized protein BKA67DRAFT_256221 [Truncatella angustata]KAH6656137.1 hypothetical protein BKA67DRAFT_256221 [Truncatella angustata]